MVTEVTVLYVDDGQHVERTLEGLEHADDGFSVRSVASAKEGLDAVAASGIDCVVSEYDLPDTDGLAFLEAVREEDSGLPFVLFTDGGSETIASEAMARGATAYLRKADRDEQYERLAERVRTAVETSRAARRAIESERVSTVIRQVNRALVRADSRDEIERRVCELLSEAKPYRFAWVGRYDPDTASIEPSNWAGVESSYLDGLTITTDETATGQGPGGRAFKTGQIAVSQDIRSDPEFEPWRADALEYGFRSVAAVPLSYEGVCYGLLAVYADRPRAFDDRERALFSDLGDDVAHAIQAREDRAELRRTKTRLESLFQNSPDMINVHDESGTLVDANPALCEELGYTKAELTGMAVWDIDVNADPEWASDFWDGLDVGDRHELETEFRRRDGSTFPAEVHLRRIRVEGSEQFVVNSRDISEQRERQQRLEAHSEAISSATDGMAILDENEEYVFVNQAHAEVYGYDDPSAFVGESWQTCYTEREVARFEREVFPELQQAGEWLGEATGRRANGETFPQEVSLTRLEDGGLICVVRDVTKRKEYTEKLERVQRRTRMLMSTPTVEESADVAVETVREVLGARLSGFHRLSEDGETLRLVTDATGMESSFETLPHYDRASDDPASSVVWDVFDGGEPLHVEDTGEHDVLAGHTPSGSAIIYPVADQGVFIVSATDAHAFDETDRAIVDILASTLAVALQRVERESLLRERERELSRQNERLEEFASVVSHDLRNPLSVLEGSLELAEATGEAEHFERSERALDRMNQLIEELLDLARNGETVTETEPIDLESIATGCWHNVTTGEASLHVEGTDRFYASRSRLKQLLENLFRNAVEHASVGSRAQSDDAVERARESVTVRVGLLEDEDGFYVADDGPGVPPSERTAVFESGYSNSAEGTGFGLAIVGRIADAHGWDVELGESVDGGARFEISGVERVE